MLRSDTRARPARDHPRAPLPDRAHVAQRRAAADGQAEGPPGARGVLGLLPRQLAAYAPLPEGLARALRGRGPARDRRAHRRVPALARRGGDRGGGRAARDLLSGRARHGPGDLGHVRQRGLARALPVGHPGRAVLAPLRRGRLPRDRAGDPGAARRRARHGRAGAPPRTSPACCCPPRPRISRAPTPAPTRRAGSGRCCRAAAS